MKELNRENVKAFVKWSEKHYKCNIVDKKSDMYSCMLDVVQTLKMCGRKEAEKTMLSRSMSLPGGNIWLNFVPGSAKTPRALCGEMGIIVHELRHHEDRLSNALFDIQYLTNASFRVRAEIEALKGEMGIYYMFGFKPSVKKMLDMLGSYRLRTLDLLVAKKSLTSFQKHVKTCTFQGSTPEWWNA